jgi:hypothetical protein
MTELFVDRKAEFSPCRTYRNCLRIVWNKDLPVAAFVGLNPSTADEFRDDPTIRRERGFAVAWGCGGLLKLNIFAFRSTDPKVMLNHPEPIGPVNSIQYMNAKLADIKGPKIAAWGKHGAHRGRGDEVLRMVPGLQYLRLNGDGSPAHPLYLPASLVPKFFEVCR